MLPPVSRGNCQGESTYIPTIAALSPYHRNFCAKKEFDDIQTRKRPLTGAVVPEPRSCLAAEKITPIALLASLYYPRKGMRVSPIHSTSNGQRSIFIFPFRSALISLLSILVSGCSADTSPTNHFRLSDVIPTGKTTVEVMEIRFSPRVEELATRFSSAVATNQEWWMDYVKKHVDEHPLPYHTNLGISAQEYAEYLDGAEKTRHLRKASDAYVTFKRKGDLRSIDIGDASSPVEKWQLNLSTGDLLMPAGDAGKPQWKSSNDTTQPLGAYEGYSWRFEATNATMSDIQTASLWIYRLKENGMIFWRIKDGELRGNQTVRSLDLQFRYDPKRKPQP
jgi:hypothetical protein